MGGFGSGRPARRVMVESATKLPVRHLVEHEMLRPGASWRVAMEWSNGVRARVSGEIGETVGSVVVERLADQWGRISKAPVRIVVEGREQPLGGLSWFWRCPWTGRLCRALLLPPGGRAFASREAYRLRYHSQRLAPYERLCQRAFRLRARLDDHGEIGGHVRRPHGMRRARFNREVARLHDIEAGIEQRLEALLSRHLANDASALAGFV